MFKIVHLNKYINIWGAVVVVIVW